MHGRSSIMMAAVWFVIGCQSGTEFEEVAWSSKSHSVLGKDLVTPELRVYRPVGENASFSVLRDAAVEILLQAVDSQDPLLRANAIEALHSTPQYLDMAVRQGLVDQNRGVRFVAAMTVGDLRMKDVAHLLVPLLEDSSHSVQAAAIFAMYRCGNEVDLSPLARFLFSDDAESRANAALILGDLGNPSAVDMLRLAASKPLTRIGPARKRVVDLQIAESLIRLGEDSELEVVRAALFAPVDQGEIVALACQICGRVGDGQAIPNLLDLALRGGKRQQSAEIRMAAAAAVAKIDPARSPIEVSRAYLHSSRPTLRAQAALTLGSSGHPDALKELGPMLSDTNPMVQVSVAGAILRNKQE